MIERMRMFSVWPGTPGRRQQNPRMIRSIGTPALDASHRASIISGSSSWFILATMRAGFPARLCCDLALDQIEQPRPHGHRRHQQRRASWAIGVSGQVVEQIDNIVGEPRVAGEQTHVGIEPGGLHMVVAGADVHVAAQAAASLRTTSAVLPWVFSPLTPKVTCAPTRSSSAAQCRLRSSSKRALISITQATCLPCSAARISDLTKGVSSPMR